MRLLVIALAVLVGGSTAQHQFYARAPLQPIAPYRYSNERVVSQGRITSGSSSSQGGFSTFGSSGGFSSSGSTGNPCNPSPCGPHTTCQTNNNGIALCRCQGDYVPDGNTINGCKPQCTTSDDCPDDYRCSSQKCIRVCVQGACGLNADCRARNHGAICTCPSRYSGDPHINCNPDKPEEKVLPAPIKRRPCERNPCGENAECKENGERPICSCPYGYKGDPLVRCTRGECVENRECPTYQSCQDLRCIDPCLMDVCGRNAECVTANHQPVCSCPRGYVGDSFTLCRPFDPRELCNPSPCGENTTCTVSGDRAKCACIRNYLGDPLVACYPECRHDSDCDRNQACRNEICVNPCVGACGENSYCDVKNGRAVCSCPTHYQGDPYSRCYAECTDHASCGQSRACVELRCVDPCIGACGIDANCKVTKHQPICSCPSTHTGDPFVRCRPFTPEDHCNPNPCGTNAECTPGFDRDGNDRPVCTCPRYYVGNPLLSCQMGECRENNECPLSQACYRYQCHNPCFTLDGDSVCGEDAGCKVERHTPICYCPEGYEGDPRDKCYADRRRFSVGRFK